MTREDFLSTTKQLIRLHGIDAAEAIAEGILFTETEPEVRAIIFKPVTRDLVISVCCEHFETTLDKMRRKDRRIDIRRKRQITMYLLKMRTRISYTDLGHLFFRHHTTAMQAFDKIKDLIATEKDMRKEIEYLNSKI